MTQTQQAITDALQAVLDNVDEDMGPCPMGKGEMLEKVRAALAALESASVEPAEDPITEIILRFVPVEPVAPTGYPMAWGDGTGEATERPVAPADEKGGGTHGQLPPVEPAPASAVEAGAPIEDAGACCTCETCEWLRTEGVPTPCERLADEYRRRRTEDAKPPACDCPARKAISELLKCPDGRSLTWPEIDEICRAALSAPCPIAELRDEIAQLRKNYAQSMKSANRDIEGLMASLAALKQEAVEALREAAKANWVLAYDTSRSTALRAEYERIANRADTLCERLKAEDPR